MFQKAKSITLMQDVRKGKLLMRFKAVDVDLNVSRGILGQTTLSQGSAHMLTKASTVIIGNACTLRLCPPTKPATAPKPHLRFSIFKHFTGAVEMFSADAAADEQLAGHLLRTTPKDR